MAKTITDLSNELKAEFVNNPTNREKYGLTDLAGELSVSGAVAYYNAHFSAVALESIWIFVVATCAATIYNLFDWFKQDVSFTIENERYGYTGWFNKMAKLFRFGVGINNNYTPTNSDFTESVLYSDSLTPEQLEEVQVIKHAYTEENPNGFGNKIKIATESNGEIAQLTTEQVAAFTHYINRIKPAGIPLTIINEPAEILRFGLKIWIDPLVIDSSGNRIIGSGKPVEKAIAEYLKSIEFNGEFVAMKMVDFIQLCDGVKVVHFGYATATAGNNTYTIEERYTPNSGYMKVSDFEECEINYVIE